eukprot:232828_1
MTQPMPSNVEQKESYELYNMLQSPWNLIAIDIRSYDHWKEQHVVNAINIPFDNHPSNEQIVQLLTSHQNKKSKISIGMIYYIISDRNKNYNAFICCLQRLTHQHINPKIPFYHLNISFTEWYHQYPMLCVPDMLKVENAVLKLNDCHHKPQLKNVLDEHDERFQRLVDIIQQNTIIYRKYPSCIVDRKLYLGSVNHAAMAAAIDGLNIGYIVNATDHEKCYFEDDEEHKVEYFRIPIHDQEDENISQYFDNVFQFMDVAMESDKAVLVHCSAGISRSSTIVIGWIMKTRQMTFNVARDFVKDKREVIWPNKGFERQLRVFERELFPELNHETRRESIGNSGNYRSCVIL